MSRIFTAVRLNFYIAKSNLHIAALTFALSLVLGVLTKLPVVTVVYNMMFATFMSGMIFSVEDKNNIQKLYGILPLKRTEWTYARYLYALIIGLANLALVSIAFLAISNIVGLPFDSLTCFTFLGLSIFYYCFSVSVIFPIYIRFSFSKAYILTMLPIALIGVGMMFIARKTDLSGSLSGFIEFFFARQSRILVCAFCVGIALLTVSALLACAIYKKKEL